MYLFTTHIYPEHHNFHVTVTFNFLKCICAGSDTYSKQEGRRQLFCLKQHTFHLGQTSVSPHSKFRGR